MVILKQLSTVADDLFEYFTVLWGWRLKGQDLTIFIPKFPTSKTKREKY